MNIPETSTEDLKILQKQYRRLADKGCDLPPWILEFWSNIEKELKRRDAKK